MAARHGAMHRTSGNGRAPETHFAECPGLTGRVPPEPRSRDLVAASWPGMISYSSEGTSTKSRYLRRIPWPPIPSAPAKAKPVSRAAHRAAQRGLSREYQAIIAYVVYSQVLKGAQYMKIAAELELHAKQELDHALTIAKQIDYLGGMPVVTPKPVKTSDEGRGDASF